MRGRLLSGARVGVLSRWVTPELADEVLAAGGARQSRFRSLPGRLGVYFVLGLCLYSHLPYGAALRELASGLQGELAAAGWRVPAATALTRLRRRVGDKPLELLFGRLCSALSPGRAPWSHICGLLAVAWDGTTVKAAAGPANVAAFGKPGTGRGRKKSAGGGEPGGCAVAYPQIRLVALVACGTRALLAAAIGPLATGEQALARDLLAGLRPGMLLLADRGFYSWRLWHAAAATGAGLLWRMKSSMLLPVVRPLPDGSWLTSVRDPAALRRRTVRNRPRRHRGSALPPDTAAVEGITVRVIEFEITVSTGDGGTRAERYRLATTLLDHTAFPAADLAAGYAWRWAIETGFREFKTYLRGPGRVLRGRTPELARQELWAYLVIYQAIRAVICIAAAGRNLDPDRISFTATLHAVRRTLATARTSPAAALAETEADILGQLIPERAARVCARAVHEPISRFPSRYNTKDPLSQHAAYTTTIIRPAQPPHTTTDQAQQLRNQQNQPP
jgi:hypothetical protein